MANSWHGNLSFSQFYSTVPQLNVSRPWMASHPSTLGCGVCTLNWMRSANTISRFSPTANISGIWGWLLGRGLIGAPVSIVDKQTIKPFSAWRRFSTAVLWLGQRWYEIVIEKKVKQVWSKAVQGGLGKRKGKRESKGVGFLRGARGLRRQKKMF